MRVRVLGYAAGLSLFALTSVAAAQTGVSANLTRIVQNTASHAGGFDPGRYRVDLGQPVLRVEVPTSEKRTWVTFIKRPARGVQLQRQATLVIPFRAEIAAGFPKGYGFEGHLEIQSRGPGLPSTVRPWLHGLNREIGGLTAHTMLDPYSRPAFARPMGRK